MDVINYGKMKKVGEFTFMPPSVILHQDDIFFVEHFTSIEKTGDIVFDGEKNIFVMPLYVQYVEGGYWDDGALKTTFGVVIPYYIVKEKHFY